RAYDIVVARIDLAIANAGEVARVRLVSGDAAALQELAEISESLGFPLPIKPRQPRLASEQLLHRGLLDVALLGDEAVELGEQRVDVREGGGDGALLLQRWQR